MKNENKLVQDTEQRQTITNKTKQSKKKNKNKV